LLGVWTGTNLIGYGKESKSFIAETTDIETLAVTATVLKFAITRGLTWVGRENWTRVSRLRVSRPESWSGCVQNPD